MFHVPQGTIGTGMKGKVNCFDLPQAEEIAKIKRQEGLHVRIHERPLTQGLRVHPITVSWWVG